MLKAALFDLDGTSVETEHLQYMAWKEVLEPFGVSLEKKEYISQYAGKVGKIIEAELIEKYGLETRPGLLLQQKENLVLEYFLTKPLEVRPYARETIEFFASRPDIMTAIVTSGPMAEVVVKLKRTGLYDRFDAIASADQVENGKPHPDLYILGIEKLGEKAGFRIRPEECVAFEDTQYGVESAKAAGVVCLAVPNEYSESQDFSMADGVFQDLGDALRWAREKYGL